MARGFRGEGKTFCNGWSHKPITDQDYTLFEATTTATARTKSIMSGKRDEAK
jgi:hypothetical protein